MADVVIQKKTTGNFARLLILDFLFLAPVVMFTMRGSWAYGVAIWVLLKAMAYVVRGRK